ncbi:MAG: hypothetical protein IJX28_02590 [Clostridia bacterium]|nr:hypothetical protein [Clostridia bacterium]
MKKQTIAIKSAVLLLVAAMLLTILTACQTPDKEMSGTTEAPVIATTVVTENTDENGLYYDDLPEDLDFNRIFRILGCQQQAYQFQGTHAEDEDAIQRAIYERNMTVEERLGVEIEWDLVQGTWGTRETFLTALQTACDGGTPHDGVIAYNLVPPVVAVRGYAANLYGAEYIDLSAPWWPSVYRREMLINDQIYSLEETNDHGVLMSMLAVFFDNDRLESRNLESPYDLVAKNEWTMEKLSEMIKDTYEDFDNDQKVSAGDIFGVCTASNSKIDAWFYGCGYRFSEVQNGEVVSLVESPELNDCLDTLIGFLNNNDVYPYDTSQGKMFYEKRAYFYSGGVYLARYTEGEVNFGIVPQPKLNSEQERYYTHLSNEHDAWCVPYNVKDMDCTSAVMECMASESYRQIGPLYFETYLKLRLAPDERLAGMYDLIREGITFDFIYLYTCVYSQSPKDQFKNCYLKPATYQWASTLAQYKNTWTAAFQQILDTYDK